MRKHLAVRLFAVTAAAALAAVAWTLVRLVAVLVLLPLGVYVWRALTVRSMAHRMEARQAATKAP
jgi:hypothetical protein